MAFISADLSNTVCMYILASSNNVIFRTVCFRNEAPWSAMIIGWTSTLVLKASLKLYFAMNKEQKNKLRL